MELEYYFVAFVDILGFSEMVNHDCHSGNSGPEYLPRIKTALGDTERLLPPGDFRLIQFSDSIILSRKYVADKDVFGQFILATANLQSVLFQQNIICRGGIAHGKHAQDETVLFSQALVEAYRLESTIAQVSRVIISQDLLDLFGYENFPIVTDRDGHSFVDFLAGSRFSDVQTSLSIIEANPAKSSSVASKYRWLSEYCRLIHPGIVSSFTFEMVRH